MIRIRFFIAIVLLCNFFSCEKTSKLTYIPESKIGYNELLISVLPEDGIILDLTQYIDSVKYVKLELIEKSLIGSIDKVVIFEERIYILDRQTRSLLVFDIEGNFIFKIDKVGQGPGEYIQLDFFDIDRENRQIVLTDLMAYWVMRYDFDGKFLFRQKIPVWCYGVSVLPNYGIVLYADLQNNSDKLAQEYNLIYLDSAMNFQKGYFPYNSKDFDQRNKPLLTLGGQFYTFDNYLHFSFPSGSIVYKVVGDSLINKYQFDFGKDMLPVENSARLKQFNEHLNEEIYNGFSTTVMENEEILFFRMKTKVAPGLVYTVYYSKESKKILSSFMFMIDGKFSVFTPITGYDSWIVSEVPSFSLVGWREKFLNEKISTSHRFTKERLAFAESLTENDNPVLMFMKFKPF